jgi:hypothetical protein
LIGAAAPGIAQGAQQGINAYQNHVDNSMLPQTQDLANGAKASVDAPDLPNPLSDPNHPAWNVMANMTGGQGGPLIGGNVSDAGAPMAINTSNARPALPDNMGMQNGGLVRQNFGKAQVMPAMTRGPYAPGQALPTGPNNTVTAPPTARGGMLTMENGGPVPAYDPTTRSTGLGQGITPASTEGQILTMDSGGVVPSGFVQQPGLTGVPMSGRGAALVEGLQAGQNLGHNFQQQWQENEYRTKAGANAYNTAMTDVNNPPPANGTDYAEASPLDHAKAAVEGFFKTIHDHTLGDHDKPNNASAIPGAGAPGANPGQPGAAPNTGSTATVPGAAGAGAPGANPSQPGLPAVVPGAPAPGNPGAAGAPGQPPPGIAAPGNAAPAIPVGGAAGGSPAPGAQPGAQPNGQPPSGGPTPVAKALSQDAVQTANASVGAKTGTPAQSPAESGLAHSLTPAQWQKMTQMKAVALAAGIRAGEDPQKLAESLDAAQNAHFQGQIVKQLATANVAFQNGDMDATKKALANVNYYLPNGQDIKFKPADAANVAADPTGQTKIGDPMYANPFHGLAGHESEPEYTKIDSNHIQMLGVAALDPMNVQKAMLAQYSAQNERQIGMLKAQGEYLQGKGRADFGSANLQNADTNAKLAGGKDFLNRMSGVAKEKEGEMWAAKAGQEKQGGQFKVTEADYNRLGQEAIAGVRGNVQGKLRTPPAMIPDPNDPTGKTMIPNMSPGAGKPAPSGEAIPSLYQGMSANTQNKVENLSAQIAGSNVGLVNPQEAGDIAARVIRFDEGGGKGTHMNPVNHKVEPDVILDPAGNSLHVWTGNGYKAVWASPNLDRSSGKESALPTGSAPPTAAGNEAPPADMAS